MKKISLYLKPSQIAELQKVSKETGIPLSELIRRAINDYLKTRHAD
jgi:metal-responsive CopG/Arc/MetJ family transcriptional regulator